MGQESTPVLTRAGDNKCHNTIKAYDEEDIWYDVSVGHFDIRRSPNFEDSVNNNGLCNTTCVPPGRKSRTP